MSLFRNFVGVKMQLITAHIHRTVLQLKGAAICLERRVAHCWCSICIVDSEIHKHFAYIFLFNSQNKLNSIREREPH